MRMHALMMALVFLGCDDGVSTPLLASGDGGGGVGDGTFEPDDGVERHPWYVADGPGGPVIQIPVAYPRIGGLYVHTREMSNAEARALGADIDPDALPNLPVLVDYPTAAAIANAASMRDGLAPCYAMPIGTDPSLRHCDGWRLATYAEWTALADDAVPEADEWRGQDQREPCADALDKRDVCYACNCADGPAPVGASVPNRFGLQDMLGNAPDIIVGGGHMGGGWQTTWPQIRSGRVLEEPSRAAVRGALRLVSLPTL